MSQVVIQALPSNTGNIYIGNSSVDGSQGGVLPAGVAMEIQADSYEGDSDFTVIDLSSIFIDADTNGEGVSICYLDELQKNLNL